MNERRTTLARGLRATIRQLEILKRHQPERMAELTRRQEEMRAKLRALARQARGGWAA